MDLKIEKEDLITSTDFMETIRLIGIGIIFGIANVIPGVSGGTIAVVFNVYDRLINVITLNLKKIVKEWKFLVPLALGAVVGVILFSKLISLLFTRFPVQTNWFFIGIILGSIPMIYSRIIEPAKIISDDESETIQDKKKIPYVSSFISCVVALAVMIVMTFSDVAEAGNVVYTELTGSLGFRVFIGLALAAIAMIIPGISGSFLMLVVGVYSTIITAIADFNIPILLIGSFGALSGLLFGAGLVRFLMNRVPSQTYGAILGLVLGSILVIFPGFGSIPVFAVSMLCAFAGFAISYFASKE